MARMAIIQTELTRDTIPPEELVRIPEGEVRNQTLIHKGDWIGFDLEVPREFGYVNFGRSRGLNVKTGELHIGNIQVESRLERRLEEDSRDFSRPQTRSGQVYGRAPIIMELERLAREQIGTMELLDVYNDYDPKNKTSSDIEAFETWKAQYLAAVTASKTGKPRIEHFYRHNRQRGDRMLMPSVLRTFFGERIHTMMSQIR